MMQEPYDMNSMYNIFRATFLCVGLALGLSLSACSKSNDDGGGNTSSSSSSIGIANNPEYVDFKATETSRDLKVVGGGVWRVKEKLDVDWLSVSRQGSSVRVTLQPNEGEDTRSAVIVLSNETSSKEVTIRQLGALPQILVSNSIMTIGAVGGSLDIIITTNVDDFEVKLPEWIENKSNQARATMRDVSHSYTVKPNKSDEVRSFNVEIIEKKTNASREAVKALIAVTQQGLSAYSSQSADKIIGDTKLTIRSGTASSEHATEPITKAFDGNYSTIYHSNWNNKNVPNYFPITLTFTLSEPSNIDYMLYYPRQDGYNGHFKEVDIEYSTDGNTYHKLTTKDFKGVSHPSRVDFTSVRNEKIKAVRLVVKSGHGDDQGFASAAEIEFYQKNSEGFVPSTLFADDICSKLRTGITEQDITSCRDEFFRNLAFFMYQNKYDTEFRVHTIKAYPNPYKHLESNKMQYAYSMLDNPTGIAVETNETLVVIVGDTHGHDGLTLRVIDYYQGGTGDGIWNAKNYSLQQGINKVKMTSKGLAYIIYTKETINEADAAQPIKVHIASGTVNGYFDTQNPNHNNRWQELLNKAKHPYFDLVGLKSHIAFPTQIFKENTPDGKALADEYDKIVHAEQELHGLVRYGRTFKNRMLLCPTYTKGAFMYATHEHTAYSPNTLKDLASLNQLRNGVWGPAHEIGHMHQTVPAVLWQGLTECTVNIPSAYVQTVIMKKECRLQVENMGENNVYTNHNRYTYAFTNIIAKKVAHGEDGDVFRKLVPFWQLQLYFGKVKGNSPDQMMDKDGFYPRLYEYCRNNAAPQREGKKGEEKVFNGANQLEFVYIASKVANYNLLDFFDKWGFLRPINREIEDYDKEWLTITESQIQDLRRRVEALNLPRLGNIPLEYITDRNSHLFTAPQAIIPGTAKRTNNIIRTQGWQNVVAYEVLDANNNIVFITDGVYTNGTSYEPDGYINLSIPGGTTWKNGYKIKAVAANGDRVDVTLSSSTN